MNTIGIIGAGPMGSALVAAFGGHVAVCDRNEERARAAGAVRWYTDPNAMLLDVDTVIIAVRPQAFEALAKSITVDLSHKLIVSVMAGVTVKHLRAATGADAIVRCMPNLGVRVATGVTGWFASPGVNEGQCAFIRDLFERLGVQVAVEREELLDAVTAISGSGPAYFFLLAEALASAGESLGLPPDDAQRLAEATLVTSGKLMDESDQSAGEWKREIAVAGGTTEAAIHAFEAKDFEGVVFSAAEAARRRAEALK